jgi:D-glycero-D-manno-heptose 1,7-bisphosphate phosphatase
MQRAVFLDRDGVLNRAIIRGGKPYPPATLESLEILPGVAEACSTLRRAGLKLVMVTNQPDVSRGTVSRATVDALNGEVKRFLQLDDVRVCPHDEKDGCDCRKPAPGLLLAAAHEADIALGSSVMVGDRWRDVECGKRAGCRTVFVDRGYSERRPQAPDLVVGELSDAVPWILRTIFNQAGSDCR